MKKRSIIFSICFLILMSVIAIGVKTKSNISQASLPVNYMNASWSYAYKDLNELADKSDLIALVKVTGINKELNEDNIDFTEYNVTIEKGIINSQDNQKITLFMTGVNNNNKHYEILDDPLPNKNDTFLIFARKNDDGSYSILGGPQGRFFYKEGKLNSLNHITDRVKAGNIDIKDKDFNNLETKIKNHNKDPKINID